MRSETLQESSELGSSCYEPGVVSRPKAPQRPIRLCMICVIGWEGRNTHESGTQLLTKGE